MRFLAVLLSWAFLPVCMAQQQAIVGVLSANPYLSPDEVARLESRLLEQPDDLSTRLRLLTQYQTLMQPALGNLRPDYQAARLKHVVYLIEKHPGEPATAGQLTYVSSVNPTDHETVRSAWLRAVEAHPNVPEVKVNAARFLYVEHPEAAEELLVRSLSANQSDRKVAANLGFFYAMDILGLVWPGGPGTKRQDDERLRLAARAREELDRTNNAIVLAAAATALPNLFMRSGGASTPNADRTPFELNSSLLSRARQLAPTDSELQGPMPLVHEFENFTNRQSAQVAVRPQIIQGESNSLLPAPIITGDQPAIIRIGSEVQAAKLIEKPTPVYPPAAKEARIQGIVRFNVTLAADGSVENATLLSGHPLLVPSATDAVRKYRFRPTLLNGTPVKVVTAIEVPFTLNTP